MQIFSDKLPPGKHGKNSSNDYVIRMLDSPLAVDASDWNALLAAQGPDGALYVIEDGKDGRLIRLAPREG